jgi:hypothetical protein
MDTLYHKTFTSVIVHVKGSRLIVPKLSFRWGFSFHNFLRTYDSSSKAKLDSLFSTIQTLILRDDFARPLENYQGGLPLRTRNRKT